MNKVHVSIGIWSKYTHRVKQVEARLKEEYGLEDTFVDTETSKIQYDIWGKMDPALIEKAEDEIVEICYVEEEKGTFEEVRRLRRKKGDTVRLTPIEQVESNNP